MKKIKAFFDWSSPSPTGRQQNDHQIRNPAIQTLERSNKNIFDTFKKGVLYCWVEPVLLPKRPKFTFDFNLFIDGGNMIHKQRFAATFDQIQKVLNVVKHYDDCFAVKRFPSSM